MILHREYTVRIDTQEKRRKLRFPERLVCMDPRDHTRRRTVRLHVEEAPLATGDYLLKGYEGCTIIEKKGSIREVAHNTLTRDRARLIREFERLQAECSHPVLLLEGTATSLLTDSADVPYPGPALDGLFRLTTQYGIDLMVVPFSTASQRLALGTLVAHLLLAGALKCPNRTTFTTNPSTSTGT